MRKKIELTYARLIEVLDYDPVTGEFVWKHINNHNLHAGYRAGRISKTYGYRIIGVDGRRYRAGRLAFLYMTKKWPDPTIDHKNRDRADDRWCNLREADYSTQNKNHGYYLSLLPIAMPRLRGIIRTLTREENTMSQASITPRVVLKRVPVKGSIEQAMSAFYSVMQELRDEIQDVVDGAEGGRAETQRMQTLADTASELDGFADDEQEMPPSPDGAPEPGIVTWTENHRRGISRSDRRDNGINAIDAAISELEDLMANVDSAIAALGDDDPDDDADSEFENYKDELATLRDTLDDHKGTAESLEFPGR